MKWVSFAIPILIVFVFAVAICGQRSLMASVSGAKVEDVTFKWEPEPGARSATLDVVIPGKIDDVAGDASVPVEVLVAAKVPSQAAPEPAPHGAILAADLTARYQWLMASMGIWLSFAAILAVARSPLSQLEPTPEGKHLVMRMAGIGLVIGIVIALLPSLADPLRQVAADCPGFADPAGAEASSRGATSAGAADFTGRCALNWAAKSGTTLTSTTLDWSGWLLLLNAAVGTAAIGLLAGCFMVLARPNATDAPQLRSRIHLFYYLLGTGALLLSFAVAASRAYYGWAAALVWPPASQQLSDIASLAAGYWGFVYTLMLAVAGGICAYGISRDISVLPDDKKPREDWLKSEGFTFGPAGRLSAILLAAAPLATSPLLDMLEAVLSAPG